MYHPRVKNSKPSCSRCSACPLERELPLRQRLWQQGWLRKSLILIVLAILWEAVARYQNNDLLLPSFLQTATRCTTACSAASCWARCGSRWWCCSRAT